MLQHQLNARNRQIELLILVLQVYSADKVRSLLADLQAEAAMMLLFLKCVQKIDVHEWLPGDGAPMLRFSCSLQGLSSSLLAQRSLFASAAADPGALLNS